MVAQVSKKIQAVEKGEENEHISHFQSLLTSLKKVTEVFSGIFKKQEQAKKPPSSQKGETAATSPETPGPDTPPPPPPLKIAHTGELLGVCFPLSKGEVLDPVPGQKQDISFNNF